MTNLNEEIVSLENASPLEVAKAIETFLDNKKGRDIKVLHVEDVTSIADYFVVCTATSNTHVKALSGEVEYQLERRGVNAYHIEGRDNNSWVVLDYCNVLVHIFNREARDFYNLDKLYENTTAVEE
ncbi:MAG: ribosome silencing factor [Clostridia bacterium]|nr:ribosome silencing factor [Clostridia bacterium]